jgi:hypothetical protein
MARISDAAQNRMREVWTASIPCEYQPDAPGCTGHPVNRGAIIAPLPSDETLSSFWRKLPPPRGWRDL